MLPVSVGCLHTCSEEVRAWPSSGSDSRNGPVREREGGRKKGRNPEGEKEKERLRKGGKEAGKGFDEY